MSQKPRSPHQNTAAPQAHLRGLGIGRWFKNVWQLSRKELQSLLGDVTLMALVAVVFSVVVYSVATGITSEVKNASVAVIDGDRSALSYRIRDALQPPYFQTPVPIAREDVDTLMDKGDYVFVLDIPPNIEADVLAGRAPQIQVLADATAMTLAGMGSGYINQIVQQEVAAFTHSGSLEAALPIKPVVSVWFNPNGETPWFTAMMQVLASTTLLSMIVAGAAVIREREHGTIEHLLVMPVRASEIAMAKILTNSAVIALAAWLSLRLVVMVWLQIPINGSIALFMAGTVLYLFSMTSLGVWLATLTPNMPQFGLLCLPIYMVTRLLSGADAPLEAMPQWIQQATQFSPVTQYAKFSQDVLFRSAEVAIVWPQLAAMTAMGAVFLTLALLRFRSMLARQG